MNKVLFICMPFAPTVMPSIGLSLLKARLAEEGYSSDIKYFNIDLAKRIGQELHERICSYGGSILIGEWLFAQHVFKQDLKTEKDYMTFLKKYFVPSEIEELLSIRPKIDDFLDHCLKSISWEDYEFIGFSTMLDQNMSSLSLVSRIKKRFPEKIIVFGGANCEGKMGKELHRSFPLVDYVFSGEADFTFPEFLKRWQAKVSFGDISGISYRQNGHSFTTDGSGLVTQMDVLPYPDFDDYFSQVIEITESQIMDFWLPMETSRGCWWGEKSQCRFCGLNRHNLHFRSKKKERVLQELIYLVEKYHPTLIFMLDNILDMKYFNGLIPDLQKLNHNLQFFYEVKANLNEKQVRMLAEAGVTWIQPGIESLSTHVLRLMAKGVAALQNIQLLKYCKQFGVFPTWSIITGFPGEKKEDYFAIEQLIYNKIIHLPPPRGQIRFILQRFSPYLQNSEQFGILNVRPQEVYGFIYALPESSLRNLAYNFTFDYRQDVKPPDCDKELTQAVEYWKACYEQGVTLFCQPMDVETLLILDSRSSARLEQIMLTGPQKDIYEYCHQIHGFRSIFSHVREQHSHYSIRERDVRDFLEEMVSLNIMVSEKNKYLSLAIPMEETQVEGKNKEEQCLRKKNF